MSECKLQVGETYKSENQYVLNGNSYNTVSKSEDGIF